MRFSEFESWITEPGLKQVATHWHEVCRGRAMPSWSDLNPARMAANLSNVWSFRYDAAADEFYGRLVGESIARHIGKDFRGLKLAESYPADAVGWVRRIFKRVVGEPALYGHHGVMYRQLERSGSGERIILPLSSDGRTADGLLGATMFENVRNAPLTLMPPSESSERWFSITVPR
jgi:hypothetical protein